MSSDTHREEIVDSRVQKGHSNKVPRKKWGSSKVPKGWEPFGNASDKVKKRYKKRLEKCHTSMKTAIELNCIECMGYSRSEATKCESLTCPLYSYNRRIFLGEGRNKKDLTDEQRAAIGRRLKKARE